MTGTNNSGNSGKMCGMCYTGVIPPLNSFLDCIIYVTLNTYIMFFSIHLYITAELFVKIIIKDCKQLINGQLSE